MNTVRIRWIRKNEMLLRNAALLLVIVGFYLASRDDKLSQFSAVGALIVAVVLFRVYSGKGIDGRPMGGSLSPAIQKITAITIFGLVALFLLYDLMHGHI